MSIKIYLSDPVFAEIRRNLVTLTVYDSIPGKEYRDSVFGLGHGHWYRVSHLLWSGGVMNYCLDVYDFAEKPIELCVPFTEEELLFHSPIGQRFYTVRSLTRGRETFDETPYFNRVEA